MPAFPDDDSDQLIHSRKEKNMNSEELKNRAKDDLGQMLEAHGIKADISEHHVEKLNASYDALSATPEGSRIGVNANLSAICDAIEDGHRKSWDYELE